MREALELRLESRRRTVLGIVQRLGEAASRLFEVAFPEPVSEWGC